MKLVLLLALLTVSECGSSSIFGELGLNVTLPCTYDIKYYGPLSVCWNRGAIPNQGCDPLLISTDGYKVKQKTQASSKYQLLGSLDLGDVSLTILNLSEADAGQYGCRVEIPGWFNDDKHHTELIVVPPTTPTIASSSSSSAWVTESTVDTQTTGHVASTESLMTLSPVSVSSVEEDGGLTVVLVSVLFSLVFLVCAGGIFIAARRWRRLKKMPPHQRVNSILFNSSSSTLQLHRPASAVENIYDIQENDYDYCP